MRIDTTRGDWIRAARVYAHCLDRRADKGFDPGQCRFGAEWARDIANELAAMDLWDAAVNSTRRADA